MQYDQARQLILDLLRNQKNVLNRELIDAIGHNQPLFGQIREDLISAGLAGDFREIGLVFVTQAAALPAQAATKDTYDIFFSYAHRDNEEGKIDEIVNQIKAKHMVFSRDHLRIFYDREGIQTMDDWEHKILRALKTCKVMVAVLTPNYFASDYCRREWKRFLELEMDYALDGQAIAPLYVLTFPEFEKNPEETMEDWLKDLKRRQYEDLRPWWGEGMQVLQAEVIEERFALLEQQCYDRIQKADRHISGHSTVPPHNRKFVGRREELRQIREHLAMGHTGTLVVLQGLAGMGKSALAYEYAHLFGDEYPGGRYLVQAANRNDLKTAIIGLAEDKDVPLTDEERKDPELAYRKVRAAFEQGEASLILFDNVDYAELLAPEQVAHLLPSADHVHVMATTRLSAGQFSGAEVLSVQELTEENALRLLEHHRPFADESAKSAAKEIAGLLQGYTLAVEVVAVFLWKNPELSYPQYLEQLRQMGIQTLDISGTQDEVQLSRHQEKMISRLIAPTLEQLSETEQQVIQYASLLPPDQIALPWLKDLVAREKENIWQTNNILDPWQRLVRRIKGLGLFTQTQEPNIVRMHRIIQAVVQNHWNIEQLQKQVSEYVEQQAERMTEQWHDREKLWNMAPLISYCEKELIKDSAEGVELAAFVHQLPKQLGRYAEAYQLALKAVQVAEKLFQPPHPSLARNYSNLATIGQDLGNYEEARKWMLKAIEENDEKVYQPPHPSFGRSYSNLAMIEKDLGNYAYAREFMLKAIEENDEKVYQAPHPKLGIRYSNLALIEQDMGNYAAARDWMFKAIEENEEILYQPPHPSLGRSYSNLALIEKDLGNYPEARKWMLKAIEENDEKVYQTPHPILGIRYSNLAIIEKDFGNYAAARVWMFKAIEENDEKVYQPPHPSLGRSYSNLAQIEQDLGNYAEARKLILKAIEENEEKVYQPPHPSLGISYSNLAMIEKDLGNYAEAKKWMLKAIKENDEKVYKPPHPSLGRSYSNLAAIEQDLGNYTEARNWMLKAIRENMEKIYLPPHTFLGINYSNLAAIEQRLGNYAEAKNWMLKVIRENMEKIYLPPHPSLGRSYSNLAMIEKDLGNYAEARKWMFKAIEENEEKVYQPPHPSLGRSYSNLAMIEQDLGNYAAAREWMLKSIFENYLKLFQPPHPQLGIMSYHLAHIEYTLGNTEAACNCMSFSYENYIGYYGIDHQDTKNVESWLQSWGC